MISKSKNIQNIQNILNIDVSDSSLTEKLVSNDCSLISDGWRRMRIGSAILAIMIGICLSDYSHATLVIGKKAKSISLTGDEGGLTSGKAWKSESLTGKVHLLFYVDPDEKELNEHVEKAIKSQKFSDNKFASVAVINMKDTWMPNFAIASKIKDKQKAYPKTIYVLDKVGALSKNWKLKKDSYDVVVFDKNGVVQFSHDGKLAAKDVKALVSTIQRIL